MKKFVCPVCGYVYEGDSIPEGFVCPTCKQKLRVPRGKGKISITCPKCATSFIKKT